MYALDNVDNFGQPLTSCPDLLALDFVVKADGDVADQTLGALRCWILVGVCRSKTKAEIVQIWWETLTRH